jgi:SAM-dependent methyltransferase
MSFTRPFLLGKPYFPEHSSNLMSDEGNVENARVRFLKSRFRNLDYLLSTRYSWMNRYIRRGMNVIEIGCGAGLSPLYISEKVLLTDAADHAWVERFIDATDMALESESVDVLIASHTIHHFYSPARFLDEAARVLRDDGRLLVHEINTSFFMRLLLRIMRHEGWSYDVNVFDRNAVVNDHRDLWSANCATPEMLFADPARFERAFPLLQIELNKPCEFLLFPASGGVIAKAPVPELPLPILLLINRIDGTLVRLAPRIFAMGRRVVVRRRPRQTG